MAERFRPGDEAEAREVVAWAASERAPLEVVGAGTKRGLGRPGNLPACLDTGGLSGITWYEPAELALAARAGTPLAEIEAALAEHRQELAFEPPDLGPLLGAPANAATIGGITACNLSGPRRIKAGAARDHFLGFNAVSGRAESFKSGGRVVKNVSGYDLCKLLAGSYGTLAVLTDVTLKVLPAAEKTRTVLVFGLDDATAVEALGEATSTALDPTGLAHLPAAVTPACEVDTVSGAGTAVTAVRIEGTEASVLYRCQRLRELLGRRGATDELHGRDSAAFWREVGSVAPFVAAQRRVVWRLSVPPASAPAIVADIARDLDCAWYYDWAGGLVWLAAAGAGDGGEAAVRGAIGRARAGGHATLVRADAELRARVRVFHPQPEPLAALSARVKAQFDPLGVLNPGRMVAEG
jgi:glycolate oxidase FAD binding subunit